MKIKNIFLLLLVIFSGIFPMQFSLAGKDKTPGKKEKQKAFSHSIPIEIPDSRKIIKEEDFAYKDIAFFFRTLSLIRRAYVDQEKVTTSELLRKAIRGLMRELDPFSAYITEDQAKHLEEDTSGRFAGIGVTIMSRGHAVEIISVFEGSPAEKAGLHPGDLLIGVNGKSVSGLDIAGCVKSIKGESGTLVHLKILRKGHNGPLSLSVRRGEVKVSSLVNTAIFRKNFGYIRITQFSSTTAEDLAKKIRYFKEKNIKGLVIDLRNNPGGLLVSAIHTSSFFLKTGVEVVSTAGHLPDSRKSFKALDVPKSPPWPIVILINGSSASASEIFAGSLRDHKRAVLAGTKSFGKGSVQNIMPLGQKEGALRLTVAKYYTPSKKVIHGKGIMPDIAIPVSAAEQYHLNNGHLGRTINKKELLEKLASKDSQLQRALDILQGITLLSGK